MRRYLICLGLTLLTCAAVSAADYKLADGKIISGEAVSANDAGVIIKQAGQLGTRTPWGKFSQEALKEFAKEPKLKKFVELLVEPSPEEEKELEVKPRAARPPITVKPVEKIEPPAKAGLFAGMGTPVGFLAFLMLFGANLYAGYEIAIFRKRPRALVCGISAAAPVIGPLVFLCLPTAEAAPAEEGAEEAPREINVAHSTDESEAEAAEEVKQSVQVFKRGEYTFNRRFIETKFAGYFRLVPGETEKNTALTFVTARGEYTGRRISKINANDLNLVVQKGGAFSDAVIPLNDILEVQVRPVEG